MRSHWIAVAVSEEVSSERPLAVIAAGREFAIYRDANGVVRAVDDECPHRRVPLSLGKIINGSIRCAYHGWTFDGESGRCVSVPNFDDSERISPNFRVQAHQVIEQDGFVYLSPEVLSSQLESADIDSSDRKEALLPFSEKSAAESASYENSDQKSDENTSSDISSDIAIETYGSGVAPLNFSAYRSALLDGPQALFNIAGVRFTDFFQGNAAVSGNHIVIDREAEWGAATKKETVSAVDRPLLLRTELWRNELSSMSGSIAYRLFDENENQLAQLLMSFTQGKRNTSSFCWRFRKYKKFAHAQPIMQRIKCQLSGAYKNPVTVNSILDGHAMTALIVSVSHDCEALLL